MRIDLIVTYVSGSYKPQNKNEENIPSINIIRQVDNNVEESKEIKEVHSLPDKDKDGSKIKVDSFEVITIEIWYWKLSQSKYKFYKYNIAKTLICWFS